MPPKFLSHLRAILSIREGLLDQFYYPALDDTTAWDADQTVSKWSGRDLGTDGRNTAAPYYGRPALVLGTGRTSVAYVQQFMDLFETYRWVPNKKVQRSDHAQSRI
jgi:hypothetical protein